MKEYVAQGIVLGRRPRGIADETIDLFTKELGRIEVRAVGSRQPRSKFSSHLDVLNCVHIRLAHKSAYTLTDALTSARVHGGTKKGIRLFTLLECAYALRHLLAFAMPDARVWYYLRDMIQKGGGTIRAFLVLLGYNPLHASCIHCKAKKVAWFDCANHNFVCATCATRISQNTLIYIL